MLLETNNAFRIVTQTYFNSEHIDFWVVKVFVVLLETKKVSSAYETSVSKKRLHTKRKTLHFVVGNERFPFVVRNEQRFKNLPGVVGNKERFGDKNFSMLLPIYCLKSDLFGICFFGRLDFFSGDITKISGNMTQVSGDLTVNPGDNQLHSRILL